MIFNKTICNNSREKNFVLLSAFIIILPFTSLLISTMAGNLIYSPGGGLKGLPGRTANTRGNTLISSERVLPKSEIDRESDYKKWKVDSHLQGLIEKRIAIWKGSAESKKGRSPIKNISRWVSNVSAYRDYIRAASRRYGVDETFLMALFAWESGGDPRAISQKHAKGFGQFLKATAKDKGLVVNRVIDERLDPAKSIDAAASYISDAMRRYENYRFLVTAYYNYGPGNLRKKIRKYGLNSNLFYKLPRETKKHYINIYAIKELIDNSERHGFSYRLKPSHKKIVDRSRSYVVKKGETLLSIARQNGANVKVMLWKNPEIISPKRLISGMVINI